MINTTVEEIIKQSVKDAKQYNQKMRRLWVRKMLDYYGGNRTNQYIEDYLNLFNGCRIIAETS